MLCDRLPHAPAVMPSSPWWTSPDCESKSTLPLPSWFRQELGLSRYKTGLVESENPKTCMQALLSSDLQHSRKWNSGVWNHRVLGTLCHATGDHAIVWYVLFVLTGKKELLEIKHILGVTLKCQWQTRMDSFGRGRLPLTRERIYCLERKTSYCPEGIHVEHCQTFLEQLDLFNGKRKTKTKKQNNKLNFLCVQCWGGKTLIFSCWELINKNYNTNFLAK